jgi:hypothetical protein
MVAIIRSQQSNTVEQATNPVAVRASQTALGGLGEGLNQVGGMFDNWQEEVDTADAKAADSAYSDLIRSELYDDQTGFMYAQGGDAVNRRNDVATRIEDAQTRILGDLSPSARRAASSAMGARYQRALQNVDVYTAGQRRGYMNDASNARIISTVQDAIYNPDQIAQSLITVNQEITDMAENGGWPTEKTDLARRDAETQIHSGIITRLETAAPDAALQYLRDNRERMSGDEVARLEGILVPRVREMAGRSLGAAAAGSPNSSEYIMYENSGAIRNDPLSDRLTAAFDFLPALGVRMSVVSGGQESVAELTAEGRAQGLSGTALQEFIDAANTGSTRHNHGDSVDADFLLPDGTKLVPSNPDHLPILQQIVRRAQANGLTGFGEGADYMGEGRIHLGYGTAAIWGANGNGANASAWLTAALGDASELEDLPATGGGLESLINEPDPTTRAAAIAEYNLLTGVRERQSEIQRDAVTERVAADITRGASTSELSSADIDALGPTGYRAMQQYELSIATGRPIVTDNEMYVELFDMLSSRPADFMLERPADWIDKLDQGDWEYFVKLRADMISGTRPAAGETGSPPISTLRTAARTALESAGISDDADKSAAFERELLQWATQNPALARDPMQLNTRVNQMLIPIVIDPTGMRNKQSGPLFAMDYDGAAIDPDDDVTPGMLRDGSLKINGVTVTNDMIELFANGFNDRFQRAPDVRELVEGLTASGLYE